MIPPENVGPRRVVIREPVSVLLNHARGPTQLKDLWIEGSVVRGPVGCGAQRLGLILDHKFSRQLLEHGENSVLQVGGGLVELVVIQDHPLVVVSAAVDVER